MIELSEKEIELFRKVQIGQVFYDALDGRVNKRIVTGVSLDNLSEKTLQVFVSLYPEMSKTELHLSLENLESFEEHYFNDREKCEAFLKAIEIEELKKELKMHQSNVARVNNKLEKLENNE